MRVLSLKLTNWRSFYGEMPKIEFALDRPHNVTVFHACNGAGKTNFLNAFLWVFYGTFSPRFQMPDQLINKKAIIEAENGSAVTAKVEIEFEHDGRRHRACRTATAKRVDDLATPWSDLSVSDLQLQYVQEGGEWRSATGAKDIMESYLPPDISDFFFFDGEELGKRFEHDEAQQKRLAKQMKKFFGLEITERAQRHLKSAVSELEKQLKAVADEGLQGVIDDKERYELEHTECTEELESAEKNRDAYSAKITEIGDRLREMDEAKQYQVELDKLDKRVESLEFQLKTNRQARCDLVGRGAYTVFLDKPLSKFESLVEKLRNRGELPSGIKQEFVAHLLAEDQCICGRSLSKSEAPTHRSEVESWLGKGGLTDVEERVLRMQGEFVSMAHRAEEFWANLGRQQVVRQELKEQLHSCETRRDVISETLKESPQEDIKALELARTNAIEKRDGFVSRIGVTNSRIVKLDLNIGECTTKIAKSKSKQDKAQIAQRRASVAHEAIKCIREIHESLDETWRRRLVDRVAKRFREISTTAYRPNLDSSYRLKLLDTSGGGETEVPASGGEGQILALAFVGSIIELQKERKQGAEEDVFGADVSEYPIVMDSPYGALAGNYRERVSEYIPRIADQVVVLVTDTQWSGANERILAPITGKSYIMVYHTPRPDLVVLKQHRIQVRGQMFDQVKQSVDDSEWTEILEVSHD